tara:strand:- start:1281 stop:1673 length:393 start_codon:yes stop_codon:yes gene_type:complete
MDVGNPSNFIRIQKIFNNDIHKLKKNISGYSFSDSETKSHIKKTYKKSNYILDPHGAIGLLGLQKHSKIIQNETGIFLETAHPCKFSDIVESNINIKLDFPNKLNNIFKREKKSIKISNYSEVKEFLLKS